MSQQQSLGSQGGTPGVPDIQFLEGNDGIPVPPNAVTFILNLLGNNTQGINVTNTAPNTETITAFDAATAQKGVVALATNAEAIAGTDTAKAITSDDLKAKLGVQTLHGLAYGNSTTGVVAWLAEATNGQIPIGSTGNAPVLGNITSTGGTITITNGPGTINLENNESAPAYTNVTNAMSPYTVLSTDYFISCDATAGPIVLRFPDAPTARKEYVVKDRVGVVGGTPANTITVTTVSGVVTFDGATSLVFTDNYESLEMIFNGTNYEPF